MSEISGMSGELQSEADNYGQPYLSVVVTTRNDDEFGSGRDSIDRLQAFVNRLEEQCRRTSLDAELIVVEWNPPEGRPRVSSLLRLPDPSFCTYRFIEVPRAIHQRLRLADVLPVFPTIAKNVGIRRARGQFVLATNIDIVFSTELIDVIASRRLQPGHLYRADRRDIQPGLPVDGPLEVQMNYCASHQLRVHTRLGSYPVDPTGSPVTSTEDIVQPGTVQLGDGWHVIEGAEGSGVFRWASKHVELIVNPAHVAGADHSHLVLDLESNPYDDQSWVEIVAIEDERPLLRTRVSGRRHLEVPLWRNESNHDLRIALRVSDESPHSRRHLPLHERRDSLIYRVFSARLCPASDRAMFEYPPTGWTNAFEASSVRLNLTKAGLLVETDPRTWSYAIKYGPLLVRKDCVYRFELTFTSIEGGITVGVLAGKEDVWLPSFVKKHEESESQRFEIVVELCSEQRFWIVVSNDHPQRGCASKFVVQRLEGSVDPVEAISPPPTASSEIARRLGLPGIHFPSANWRGWISTMVDRTVAGIVSTIGPRARVRIANADPEFSALNYKLQTSEKQLLELAPLRYLADFDTLLREHRPHSLHTNECGDFQLLARQHWDELRGYPEFETISPQIEAAFSYVADAVGIKEQTLEPPIYYVEEEVGTSRSRERQAPPAIAERGIVGFDAMTVNIWGAYMRWVERPILFNSATWGFAAEILAEQTVTTQTGQAESHWVQIHPVFEMFRGFDGFAEPGFERGFYGVNIRDWLFAGTSKAFTDRRAVHIGHPPIDEEYFEWIALLTAIANSTGRFCFAELGAGWGRWAAAAAMLCRQKELDFSLIAVEPERSHFEWMKMVLADNEINPAEHELFLAAAGAESGELLLAGRDEPGTEYGHRIIDAQQLANWSSSQGFVFRPVEVMSLAQLFAKHERVDLVDMDVQGAEDEIVAGGIDVLNQKVRMIHVGTHSKEAEARLADVLWKHGWLNAFSFPNGRQVETRFGRIAFGDGVQTWVNPRWPELHRALVGVKRWTSSARAAGAHAQL